MSTYTPGPWKYALAVQNNAQNYYAVTNGKWGAPSIAVCGEEANARLIAAAPLLYAALEDLRKELQAHFRLDVKKHYSLMVADAAAGTALAKVKGEA